MSKDNLKACSTIMQILELHSSHTPGPWRTGDIYPYGAYGEDKPVKFGGQEIARVAATGDESATVANARLIAAAPELLECLRDFIETVQAVDPGIYCDAIDEAEAVIAKATGRLVE